jgi:hypothetical protein
MNRIFFSIATCEKLDKLYPVFISSLEVLGKVWVHANKPAFWDKLTAAIGEAEGHFVVVLKESVHSIEVEFRDLMKAPEK